MAKAYLVLCYLSVSNEQALQEYAKLATLWLQAHSAIPRSLISFLTSAIAH